MKKQFVYVAVLITVFMGISSSLFAQVNAGISIGGDGGLNSFYLSIGNYYHVPEREVVVIHERSIPDEEIPVVFYIARHAHVAPREVVAYRSRGCSWFEVSRHYGLGPDIYGRTVVQGPPYGNAWGYYKHNKHRNDYNNVVLSDYDIVNYVNTRVISDHYGCSQDQVHKMRNQGYNYVNINNRFYNDRYGRGNNDGRRFEKQVQENEDHENGNGRGNGNGHGNGNGRGNGNGHGNGHGHGRWARD